jgi:Predicted membrane protein
MSIPAAAPQAERVIARLRPHARAMFWPSLVLIAACGAVGYLGSTLEISWARLLVWVGGALVLACLFLLPLAHWLSVRYTITTRRIILRTGFFVRTRHEILHSRGYDITVTTTWLQSAFRTGTIRLKRGADGALVMRDVPHVDTVQSALHDLLENARNLTAALPTQSALADQAALRDRR